MKSELKLDPKYKGPFKVIEFLEGDRYVLKSLNGNRTYKYAHDRIRRMPQDYVPSELDVISEVVDVEDAGEGPSTRSD